MSEKVRVLIIEDNPIDALLVRKALGAAESCEFRVVDNGHDAFEFLKHCKTASRPDLIILDLNLPGRNGNEILELIRGTAALEDVPVAILSSYPEEVIEQHAAEADCCVTKPFHLGDFSVKARAIVDCYHTKRLSRDYDTAHV